MIQAMDLRSLCSTILAKTIADPDKYQNGLTKIFFRAGMLAALESLRSDRLNAMVTVVQKNMRRRMAVKKYAELRKATIKIQTWWRGVQAKLLVRSIRREVSAIRLQTGIRRFIQRKYFVDTKQAITLFQSRMCTMTRAIYLFLCFHRRARCTSTAALRSQEKRSGCHSPAKPSPRRVCHDLSVLNALFTNSLGRLEKLSDPMFSMSSIYSHVLDVAWLARS